MRMEAYYYEFEPTGNADIDLILSAVACAGKAFHGTDQWKDDCNPYSGHEGSTPVEWIQNAANKAARALAQPAGGDERAWFEYAFRAGDLARDEDVPEDYRNYAIREAWDGWQARAALAQQGRDAELMAVTKQRDDLLAALRGMLNAHAVPSSICKERHAYEAARAAIAAARGE